MIPVLDLARGVAVRARGGDRAGYQPVVSVLVTEGAGDPVTLLQAFRRRLGATDCYLADLDAIQGGAVQRVLLRELATLETGFAGALLVDAGAHDVESGLEVLASGASQVVVGLETLRSFAALRGIVQLIGAERVVFSLDLRHGAPLHRAGAEPAMPTNTIALAGRALEAGVRTLLVLDLARVGTGSEVDLRLVALLRSCFPGATLLAGGGVRDRASLERMRDAGCDGALVASAIHDGAVTAADLAAMASASLGAQSPSVSR